MEIHCKVSKRFLADINIEEYYESLKKVGVDITLPIKIKFACPRCKMIEEYEVYPTHYIHTKSYKKNFTK